MTVTDNDIDFVAIAAFLRGITPAPILKVSEWADTFRFLPPESARPGKFSMNVTPYNREISDRLSASDPAQKIVYKKSSQVGATETGNNWLGYTIHIVPAPMLYVMPTDMMMKDTSKNRIAKMIEYTVCLHDKISASSSRNSSNTLLYKEFEGGFVKMVGANSPVGLSSTPVKLVYMDEIDRYPLNVEGEGSALSLAITRTISYGATKKIFLTSTPTLEGTSAISAEFDKTDQRYYLVPCPHCQKKQALIFENLKYVPGQYEDAAYECSFCHAMIAERYKTWMLENGEWVALHPENSNPFLYGYHINALYSPYGMYSWGNMAQDFEEAKGDIPKTISFTNTKMGLCYKPNEGSKPDWELLYSKSNAKDNPCKPNLVLSSMVFITAGVDVQADRIEVEIVAWGKGKRTQQIDYRMLMGDTDGDDVWKDLHDILKGTWKREDGYTLPIRLMCVDSGFNTKKVYEFVNFYKATEVVAIKGRENLDVIFSAPRTVEYTRKGKKLGTAKLYGVGINILKMELYGFLKQSIDEETGEVPQGYCYFPARDIQYFKGLTAEEFVATVNKKGQTVYTWQKKEKRNEPLDCRIYSRAAAAIIGIDRWNDDRWDREMLTNGTAPNEIEKPKKPEKKKSDFWNR